MKTLTYIWHDCFIFSTPRLSVIFDYWKDPLAGDGERPLFLSRLPKDRPLYVLVSHHHKDHFVKEIFSWAQDFPLIHYIISKDTARHARHLIKGDSLYKGFRPEESQITVLKPGDVFTDSLLKVVAFGSTDIGNSYMLETEGMNIFHAGDLNAWLWKDESSEEEVKEALDCYSEILNTIYDHYPAVDIAMFPVDSRIGTGYYTGAKMLVDKIDVRRFFPMHFGLGEKEDQTSYMEDANKIELYANQSRGEYICLQAPYSKYGFS